MTITAVPMLVFVPLIGLGLLVCAAAVYTQVQAHRRLDRKRHLVDLRRE